MQGWMGCITVAWEAYHDWSSEAAGARLHVNFTLKLLLIQNFCNRPLMRFISFASNIGPVAAVPVGPALAPLHQVLIKLPKVIGTCIPEGDPTTRHHCLYQSSDKSKNILTLVLIH